MILLRRLVVAYSFPKAKHDLLLRGNFGDLWDGGVDSICAFLSASWWSSHHWETQGSVMQNALWSLMQAQLRRGRGAEELSKEARSAQARKHVPS